MPESAWDKTKRFSKKGFDKTWAAVDKLGAPVNRLSNKLGAEAFWPMELGKESDKAARILRSFCKDGFYAPDTDPGTDENGKINRPKGKQRVIKKIPEAVVKNAKGLAIFTTMRTGLWTGEWSPPSGILLHTAGIGFLAGVDIYDCVVVINTYEALEAFKKVRCTLGGEVSVAAGPVGMGGVLDSEVHKRQAPIWTYMKSKGLYAGVAVDGTIIIERTDENERFYGERISVHDILAGKARHPPQSINTLIQTVKAAQGDRDRCHLPGETPGDLELPTEGTAFGIPAADDPDPYGVKALEQEGLYIREAGTKVRPSHDVFEFRPNPSSPIFATFARQSLDGSSPRNSWRASRTSVQSYVSVDRGVQTDEPPLTSAPASVSRASSRQSGVRTGAISPWAEEEQGGWESMPTRGGRGFEEEKELESADDENHAVGFDDDVEVHEVNNAKVTKQEVSTPIEEQGPGDSPRHSPTFTRARLVTIPKRPTPPLLPPRHPRHTWGGSGSSRESVSPTALSHTSRSTEQTEAIEVSELTEPLSEPADSLPTNVKMLHTSTILPTVVDEDDPLSDYGEQPSVDKDEFHSINGDESEETEGRTVTEEPAPAYADVAGKVQEPELHKSTPLTTETAAETAKEEADVKEKTERVVEDWIKPEDISAEPTSKVSDAEKRLSTSEVDMESKEKHSTASPVQTA
ncbi:hypothetical protein N7470_006191 [Penicillium chermesinum]|nr:hypothetical protein N7470_006191 [Penicillium chermesinum]